MNPSSATEAPKLRDRLRRVHQLIIRARHENPKLLLKTQLPPPPTPYLETISFPLVITGLFLYFRSFVTIYFLCGLGGSTLAGGSLALAFANITGYSLFSGLTRGVDTICSQAFRARRYHLVRATILRGILLLLLTSIPVSLLWDSSDKILIMLDQDKSLASEAHTFLEISSLDLVTQSVLHPLTVYLKMRSKTIPLSICTGIASILHYPVTYFLVSVLSLGIKGIAMSGVVSHLTLVALLLLYIRFFDEKLHNEEEIIDSYESVRRWKMLFSFAISSYISGCFDWWYYEIIGIDKQKNNRDHQTRDSHRFTCYV